MKKHIRNILLLFIFPALLALCPAHTAAQNIGINSSGATPNASALLDLSSTSLGLLVPRMTTAQRNAIAVPAVSLLIFNTTTQCYEWYTGAVWTAMSCACSPPVAPGSISGPVSPSINSLNNVYTIAAVPGATSYTWTISGSCAGTSIQSGQGTQTLTVAYGACIQSYTICVYASNACGNGPTGPCLQVTTNPCSHGTVTFNVNGSLNVGSLQSWTIPACISQLTITAAGASGATVTKYNSNTGGLGAVMQGTFAVTGGHVVHIMVGQQGDGTVGGGSGGTFVIDATSSTILVIAGGGGGAGIGGNGLNASTSTTGVSGMVVNGGGTGGSGGGGGGGGTGYGGGGGGGYCGNGGNAAQSYGVGGTGGSGCVNGTDATGTVCINTQGLSYQNGGGGGVPTCYVNNANGYGGYGGGGDSIWGNACGGGGGGYSGGGGGGYNGGFGYGGGGGSINNGTNQTNAVTNTGAGYATIIY